MVYKVDNEFVISSNNVWRPGVFKTKRAANYAFRFTDEEIKSFGSNTITYEDLKKLRNETK